MGIPNKKKYEYFCTMCNKEIFMHHKEFLVCCVQLIIIIIKEKL